MADDLDILARTLYGEAERDDGADAIAIAWVVMNRVALPNWPDTVAAVCLQPWQFSCWNQNDPNRARIMAASDADPWLQTCRRIAGDVMKRAILDPTKRSTHYYATWMKTPPSWAKGHVPVHETPAGRYNHVFFNDIDTPPPADAKEALDQQKPLTKSKEIASGAATAVGGGLVVADAIDTIDRSRDWLSSGSLIGIAIGLGIVGLGAFIIWNRIKARKDGAR